MALFLLYLLFSLYNIPCCFIGFWGDKRSAGAWWPRRSFLGCELLTHCRDGRHVSQGPLVRFKGKLLSVFIGKVLFDKSFCVFLH